jgi:hypothetical protein
MPSGVHLPCSCLVISLLFQIVYRAAIALHPDAMDETLVSELGLGI